MRILDEGNLSMNSCVSTDGAVKVPTTEQVAAVVSGIRTIGAAGEALTAEGWVSETASDRITVEDQILARLIEETAKGSGGKVASWLITAVSGVPPAWIVGTGTDVG